VEQDSLLCNLHSDQHSSSTAFCRTRGLHGHGEQEHPPKVRAFTLEFLQKKKPSGGGFDGTNSKKILIDVLETASNETGNNFYLNVCSLLI
jgi:hypothetical protein